MIKAGANEGSQEGGGTSGEDNNPPPLFSLKKRPALLVFDWSVYPNFDLANVAAHRLSRMTGDACGVVRYSAQRWRILRVDSSGKPVS
jgi:hypothetical protein